MSIPRTMAEDTATMKTASISAHRIAASRRQNPTSSDYNRRAAAWQERGELDIAIADYNESLRLDPQHPDARAGLGRALLEQGYDGAAAEREIAAALGVNPRHADALALRAEIALDAEDGPMIFGPVVSEPPADDEAVGLWEHTAWLVRNSNFSELKRTHRPPPDLAMTRWWREQRAAQAAAPS